MTILITGAAGFVGQRLCAELSARRTPTVAVSRAKHHENISGYITYKFLSNIDHSSNWESYLDGVDVVIHLAARAHVMNDIAKDKLGEFRKTNLLGTENLAYQAAAAGVKRFVYVSSIGVNGLLSLRGEAFSEKDSPNPHNAYAQSKWEAEQSLWRISQETGLEVVIVRPPLVYGADAPGNFKALLGILTKRVPLPFASVQNLRSLVYVENLVDALIVCANHPSAAGQTYLVSDGDSISTPELLRKLGAAMGRPARLFSCPTRGLTILGKLAGKSDQVQRLLSSLQVDSSKIRRELNWMPPYTLQEGLKTTAEWYRIAQR